MEREGGGEGGGEKGENYWKTFTFLVRMEGPTGMFLSGVQPKPGSWY